MFAIFGLVAVVLDVGIVMCITNLDVCLAYFPLNRYMLSK